ncbi:Exonuclease domain-containing protein [Plasmodiophora brassicae]|uniref:Exonuclease domain-containing protein n=1 Tax=Plasmodiophora brassicae TaxID=37360 RepID=A0A0G4IWP9_PLABS|nr:hypothetical protein PBRA_007249 [Plasmodiophora brassicae]SPQ95988.1 unnamed protein product [Plasmodiophora brassicae]
MANPGKRAARYVLILDFEATCGPNVPNSEQEVIEFPIVVVDTLERRIVSEFRSFVRPLLHPILDGFCTDLTGITQDQVSGDSVPTLQEILPRAAEFVESFIARDRNAFIVTCGDWDLRTQLPSQAARECLEVPPCLRRYVNLKRDFAKLYQRKRLQCFKSMMMSLGLTIQGRHHSGIDDCRNMARIVLRMLDDGHVFRYKQ